MTTMKADPKTAQFACFEGLEQGNRFFSTNQPNEDMTKTADGKVSYKILGYANTVGEAQMILYGKEFPLSPKMTRSDMVLAIDKAKTIREKDALITRLNRKIDYAYDILYVLENDKDFHELGALLRKALES
jgi:hypothetical protein